MKEQNSGDQIDREQLARMSDTITAAMPHFQSLMGGPSDHAELALAKLIAERDALRATLEAIKNDCEDDESDIDLNDLRRAFFNAARAVLDATKGNEQEAK